MIFANILPRNWKNIRLKFLASDTITVLRACRIVKSWPFCYCFIPTVSETSSLSIWAISAGTCVVNSRIRSPTTASSSDRHRLHCTCYCFSKRVRRASVRAYPSLIPHHRLPATSSVKDCTEPWGAGRQRVNARWADSTASSSILSLMDRGEIIRWKLTPGNVDDREPLKNKRFTDRLFGNLFADRGDISQELFEMLFVDISIWWPR